MMMIERADKEDEDRKFRENKQRESEIQSSINQKTLKKVPEDQKNCTICIEDYEVGSSVTHLDCGHLFHQVCIS
jgi:RING-like zinc finger